MVHLFAATVFLYKKGLRTDLEPESSTRVEELDCQYRQMACTDIQEFIRIIGGSIQIHTIILNSRSRDALYQFMTPRVSKTNAHLVH